MNGNGARDPFTGPEDRPEYYQVNLITITPEQRQRARLKVADMATDRDDCRQLLTALGLDCLP